MKRSKRYDVKDKGVITVTNRIVKELNQFLEGNYMAIHAYDQYIYHTDEMELKKTLQNIQQNHKKHAAMIAERIQNLGGIPTQDVGMKGRFVEMMQNMKAKTTDPRHIVKDAIAGEERGIETSKEMLQGDLDPESTKLVNHILEEDEKHVERLQQVLHEKMSQV